MIYIASPYTDPDSSVRNMRYIWACRTVAKLTAEGKIVYSPICHSHGVAFHGEYEGDWDAWREHDLHMLGLADSMIVLKIPGWVESVGVKAEIEHAKKLGIPVEYIDL